jgi:hypothetical protein
MLTTDEARWIAANSAKLPRFYVEGNKAGSDVRFWG